MTPPTADAPPPPPTMTPPTADAPAPATTAEAPPPMCGLWHLALNVRELERVEAFYTAVFGMAVEWRPDLDNVYLRGGADNLALHRVPDLATGTRGALDHLGFVVPTPEAVDAWHARLLAHGAVIDTAPRTHRDGARSFYCRDPEGNRIQVLHHPPLSPLDPCTRP